MTVRQQLRTNELFAATALAFLIAYGLVRSIFGALVRPFWFDEICTLIVIKHPAVASILDCLKKGMDGQPPFFDLIERFASRLPVVPEVSMRIPSALAFSAVLICVFEIVRARAGRAVALVSIFPLFFSSLFQTYAAEARPYALFVAATAAALLCFQRMKSWRGILAFGLLLMLGESFHYYMIFVIMAFCVAELVFAIKTRHVRIEVWAALALGVVPLAVFWPLLAGMRVIYGEHFWAAPTLHALAATYGSRSWLNLGIGTFLVLLAMVALGSKVQQSSTDPGSVPLYCEQIVVLFLVLLPFTEVTVARLTHGPFTGRYAIPLLAAVPVLFSYYLSRIRRPYLLILAIAMVVPFAKNEIYLWQSWARARSVSFSTTSIQELADSVGSPKVPLAFADGLEYLKSFYYSSPSWREREVYLVDLDAALRYRKNDSVERNLLAISACAPVQVYGLKEFQHDHPVFLLEATPAFGDHWWPTELSAVGLVVTRVASDGTHEIYRVQRPLDRLGQ